MRVRNPRVLRHTVVCASLISLLGCGDQGKDDAPTPRPVSVETLGPAPVNTGDVFAGTVRAWFEEDVSSEVSGQLLFVAQSGDHVEGRWKQGDETVVEGTLIGRIDPSTYQAAAESARADLRKAQVQLDKVAPAQVAEARASFDLETELLKRVEESARMGASNETEIIEAKAQVAMASARLKLAEAGIEEARASVETARAKLTSAELDLERTHVYAPFSGVVNQTHLTAGGLVQPGTPLVHLVMMDPVLIELIVSRETASGLQMDDILRVRTPSWPETIEARVFAKSVAADPATLTFRVSLVARNPVVTPPPEPGAKLIGNVIRADVNRVGIDTNILLPDLRSILHDDRGSYVWRLSPEQQENGSGDRRTYRVQRVDVVLGDVRRNLQRLAVGRDLSDPGTLSIGDLVAFDPPPDLESGDLVSVSQTDWGLQPGESVQVRRSRQEETEMISAPLNAIVRDADGGASIFIERDGLAIRVPVKLGRLSSERQEIAAISGAPIAGEHLITRGAHLLRDGEPVRVVNGVSDGGH